MITPISLRPSRIAERARRARICARTCPRAAVGTFVSPRLALAHAGESAARRTSGHAAWAGPESFGSSCDDVGRFAGRCWRHDEQPAGTPTRRPIALLLIGVDGLHSRVLLGTHYFEQLRRLGSAELHGARHAARGGADAHLRGPGAGRARAGSRRSRGLDAVAHSELVEHVRAVAKAGSQRLVAARLATGRSCLGSAGGRRVAHSVHVPAVRTTVRSLHGSSTTVNRSEPSLEAQR